MASRLVGSTSMWWGATALASVSGLPIRLRSSPPMMAWEPSTSWSIAFPMSCSRPASRASATSAPISAAAIDEEMIEGHPGHFAANRVETAEDDGLRGVVDDQVDPGGMFQRSDIPTFPTDDAALHLVAWNGHHRDGRLRGLFGGNPLHR